MFLDNLLTSAVQWTPQGIQCPNEAIAMKAFKFMREAVLDRHISISKAVGARFTNDIHGRASTDGKMHIEGHYNCGESYPELMVNLSDKIYLGDPGVEKVTYLCNPGIVTVNDIREEIKTLCLKPYVLRTLSNIMTLEVIVRYGSGFSSMSQNSHITNEMFPFYTDYSLAEFVRVLPMMPGETFIKMKFLKGMTLHDFLLILNRWNNAVKARDIDKEELIWLQSFGL